MEDGEGQVDVRQAEHDGCAALAGDEGAEVPPRPLDLCHVIGVHHRCRRRHCCCHWPLLCCTGSRVETEDAAVGQRDRGALFWVRAGDGQIEKQQGGAVVFVGKGGRKGKEKRNRMDWRCGESKGCLQRAATCFGGEDLR